MIRTLVDGGCELAENPLWNREEGAVYWTDITAGNIHRFHPGTGEHKIIYSGDTVGGFTFQADGNLLLFRVRDLALLKPDGTVQQLREFSDEGMERFNDVIADPEGRVFAGTIGKSATGGGLYRVDRDGAITRLFLGTGCSNGMGFSPDLKKFYWTCSTRKQIYVFDYDCANGTLSNERLFYQATSDEGIPDGMTVDSNGDVWSARWDGFSVAHHGSDGTVLKRFPFPAAKVSSLCFGGPALDQFFVTTAGGTLGERGPDGALFQWSAGVSGPPEFNSRINGTGS